MDVSIQNLSRPAPTPGILPLSYLSPQQIGAPSDGVQASAVGSQIGQSLASDFKPLAQEAVNLEEYYTPANIAARQAQIATSGLQTTTANQENAAAQATPTLPLAQRNLALSQTNADATLVTPRAQLALAEAGAGTTNANIQNTEGKSFLNSGGAALTGQAASIGAANSLVGQRNVAATTVPADAVQYAAYLPNAQGQVPDTDPMTTSADYATLQKNHPELQLPPTNNGDVMRDALAGYAVTGNQAALNTLAAARRAGQASIAGNLFLSQVLGNPSTGGNALSGVPVPSTSPSSGPLSNFLNMNHMSPDGKGFTPDDITTKNVENPDTHEIDLQTFNNTKAKYLLGDGSVDPNQNKLSGDNISSQSRTNNLEAQQGFPNATMTPAELSLTAANQHQVAPNVFVPNGVWNSPTVQSARTALAANPSVHSYLAIVPSVDAAIAEFQKAKTSPNAVPLDFALQQAAQAFNRGQAGVNPEDREDVAKAQGVPARALNTFNSITTGKPIGGATIDSYIEDLNQIKSTYSTQAAAAVKAATVPLDSRIKPYAGMVFSDILPGADQIIGNGTQAPAQQPTSTTSASFYQTPQAHQDAIDWAKANPSDPRAQGILTTATQALDDQ
jgi:hypothetical protein